MAASLRRISPEQARLGMFIHGFDGSWMSHPFWRSKFLLTEPGDLEVLRACGIGILIDESQGVPLDPPSSAAPLSVPIQFVRRQPLPMRRLPPSIEARKVSNDPEYAHARQIMSQAKRAMKQLFGDIRLGRAINSAVVASIVDDISASVTRSPRTLIGIMRLKSKDEYTYLHSVAVCALMVNLGRMLDLDEPRLRELGLAGLLHDVGKSFIPDPILNKQGRLTAEEFDSVRAHPRLGHDLLLAGEGTASPAALDVCLHHHEKIDGTGYPFGLQQDAISLAARMGAICDVYDALTSNRAYKTAWTPSQAATAMHGWHGHFDEALLFKFFQSVGIFPVGMLVRLRSNRLALVLDNGRRASRQRVRAFYAITEAAPIEPEDLFLSDTLAGDQIVACEDPARWTFPGGAALLRDLLADQPGLVTDD